MTNKEKEILEIIANNPMISQEELADKLNITRSTVAVHISSLIKQGYLLGKGYVIKKQDYVVGIGAANVDIYGKSLIDMKIHYDHPSLIHTAVGGVTRNVLENLAHLGIKTKLLCAVGNDVYGKMIIDHSNKEGIDVSNVISVDNYSSGLFIQAQDNNNDMYLAMCDMSVNENINIDYIKSKDNIINNSRVIIIDPSLNDKTIDYILNKYKHIPIFIDPVSDNYALKIKKHISNIYACKPNLGELEALTDIKINNDEDIKKACIELINKGVKRIYVSLGRKGCAYMDSDYNFLKKDNVEVKNIENASGAGDSFFASVIYSFINNLDIDTSLEYAMAAAKITLMSKSAINPDLSIDLIKNILK